MNKIWILSIGTVLFLHNYDVVYGIHYTIPKTYKGKKVRVITTRDAPPSFVIPMIKRDDGTNEYLNKRTVYPELDFDSDRDRSGRVLSSTNWATAEEWRRSAPGIIDDVVALPGVNFQTKQLRQSILMAMKKLLEQVLAALQGGVK